MVLTLINVGHPTFDLQGKLYEHAFIPLSNKSTYLISSQLSFVVVSYILFLFVKPLILAYPNLFSFDNIFEILRNANPGQIACDRKKARYS